MHFCKIPRPLTGAGCLTIWVHQSLALLVLSFQFITSLNKRPCKSLSPRRAPEYPSMRPLIMPWEARWISQRGYRRDPPRRKMRRDGPYGSRETKKRNNRFVFLTHHRRHRVVTSGPFLVGLFSLWAYNGNSVHSSERQACDSSGTVATSFCSTVKNTGWHLAAFRRRRKLA